MSVRRTVLLSVVLTVLACAAPVPHFPAPPRHERRVLGESRQGRPIDAIVIGDGPRVVLFVATIHGNEAAGTPLLLDFATHLVTHPGEVEGRTVVLVPVANPDGLRHGTRANAAGVDLNRNWPSANFRPSRQTGPKALSEPESHALWRLIEKVRPAVVVSIHQPLACVDWDGPAGELAAAMATACGLPAKKLGARPGSMGSHVGVDAGIPIVTLELPDRVDAATAWTRFGGALRLALREEDSRPPVP
ncbi:MAG: DUF2817 domain-containing protein [Planctomycetota bacterium]